MDVPASSHFTASKPPPFQLRLHYSPHPGVLIAEEPSSFSCDMGRLIFTTLALCAVANSVCQFLA